MRPPERFNLAILDQRRNTMTSMRKHPGTPAPATAKLKCFVAMAFGRTHTDRWFDKTLRPLLRSVGALV